MLVFTLVRPARNRIFTKIDPMHADLRRSPRETKRRTAIPTANIENLIPVLSIDRRGQKNGIDRDPVSGLRLGQRNPATQDRIPGYRFVRRSTHRFNSVPD